MCFVVLLDGTLLQDRRRDADDGEGRRRERRRRRRIRVRSEGTVVECRR